MATYYALTTTNPAGGWRVVACARTYKRCEILTEAALGDMSDAVKNHDIYAETKLKNLVILTSSAAKKRGPKTRAAIDNYLTTPRDDTCELWKIADGIAAEEISRKLTTDDAHAWNKGVRTKHVEKLMREYDLDAMCVWHDCFPPSASECAVKNIRVTL